MEQRALSIIIGLILICPGVLIAQTQTISTTELVEKRELMIQIIDSLESRITEIDRLLSEVNPEDRLEAMISKYGKNKGRMIADGKVWPTISYEMARDSWGDPANVQKSTLSSGTTEKWSYADNRYLYFKNGRLESWKD